MTASQAAIHIVDDDAGLRVALDGLFRSVGYRTRLFGSAAEFIASDATDSAGCLVLDVRLPDISGLDFQRQLTDAGIAMPVILMTGHGDIPMSVRGMKAGAIDFLPKPFRDQDMLDAVAAALERDLAQRAKRQGSADLHARFDTLSPRERQVVGLVTSGLMNKQVAHQLELSEITVKIHRGNAMRKMGAKSLAELVKMAEMFRLKPDDPRSLTAP